MPRNVPSRPWTYTWHTGSRWYTPELCILSTDIKAFVLPWDGGMYDSGDKINVKCLLQAATFASLWCLVEIAGQPYAA